MVFCLSVTGFTNPPVGKAQAFEQLVVMLGERDAAIANKRRRRADTPPLSLLSEGCPCVTLIHVAFSYGSRKEFFPKSC